MKQVISGDGTEIHYEVQSIETSGELDRNRLNLALNLASLIRSPSLTSIDTLTPKEEIDSGNKPNSKKNWLANLIIQDIFVNISISIYV